MCKGERGTDGKAWITGVAIDHLGLIRCLEDGRRSIASEKVTKQHRKSLMLLGARMNSRISTIFLFRRLVPLSEEEEDTNFYAYGLDVASWLSGTDKNFNSDFVPSYWLDAIRALSRFVPRFEPYSR